MWSQRIHIEFARPHVFGFTADSLRINKIVPPGTGSSRSNPESSRTALLSCSSKLFLLAVLCGRQRKELPHVSKEFASKSGNFLIRSPEWKFLNPITFRIRVDGRIRIFSDTMTSQNWRQYLPRKFKYGRRSKANSFCAPWAYFQSFSLYAVKCRSTKCWNKSCQKAAWHLQALYVVYRTKRPAAGKQWRK